MKKKIQVHHHSSSVAGGATSGTAPGDLLASLAAQLQEASSVVGIAAPGGL